MKHFIVILLCCVTNNIFAYQLKGVVTDANNEPLPGASVYLSNSSYGVTTNLKGAYFLELGSGKHRIVFQMIGYKSQEFDVTIQDKIQTLNVILKEDAYQLGNITITAGEDPAYPIMRSAIKARKKYLTQYSGFTCNNYLKVSLEKEESISKVDTAATKINEVLTREKMNLLESRSRIAFKRPDNYRVEIDAYIDHTDKPTLDFGKQKEVSVTFSANKDETYAAPQHSEANGLFYEHITDADFNFYKASMSLPTLYDKPFVSPLSSTAFLSYNFKLVESFVEDSMTINKIEVIPKRKYGALFKGYVFIVEEEWAIKAVDLCIDKNALFGFLDFKFIINYDKIGTYWLPVREEFYYYSKQEKKKYIGHSLSIYSNYKVNPRFPNRFFNGAVTVYNDSATIKDATYWANARPVTLKTEENKFVKEQDSIRTKHTSVEYIKEADSSYNNTGIWDWLIMGVGKRNTAKGYSFFFAPLIAQPRPFSVGGYRHALDGSYSKKWKETGKILDLDAQTSFGILNSDLRGKASVSYLYNPLTYERIEFGAGSIYEMINTYESIAATFSRGNYAQTNHITFGYEREVINGVYVRVKALHSKQSSLEDIQLSSWSNTLFGELNEPKPFNDYAKTVVDIRGIIRFKQKYNIKDGKKIIIGSKYPQMRVHYKLGLPNIFGSQVDFQYLELRLFDDFKLGSVGETKYNVVAGSFLSSKATQFIDHKFFRGSDRTFYTAPVHSFQLLGPSINTKDPFLQGHFIHHFNGAIMNRVPLFRFLRLRTVAGGSILTEYSNNFKHAEAYLGIEKPFRIGKQLIKISAFYVGANSTHSPLDATFKFGIDFFNSQTGKWTY